MPSYVRKLRVSACWIHQDESYVDDNVRFSHLAMPTEGNGFNGQSTFVIYNTNNHKIPYVNR